MPDEKEILRQILDLYKKRNAGEDHFVGHVGSGVYKIGPGAFTNIDGWKLFEKALIEAGFASLKKENDHNDDTFFRELPR